MKILLVLGNSALQEKAVRSLRLNGCQVEVTANEHQGFYRALSGNFSAVVINPWTPGWDQDSWMPVLMEARPLLQVILVAPDDASAGQLSDRHAGHSQVVSVLTSKNLPGKLVEAINAQSKASLFRQAKIIATIGPASCDEAMLSRLLSAGVNVTRFNFSHGSHEWHKTNIEKVRRLSEKLGTYTAVLQDLCGPKIRVGKLAGGKLPLDPGEPIVIHDGRADDCRDKHFDISLPEVLKDLRTDDRILLDDGNLELIVEKEGKGQVQCRVVHGGLLKQHKGVNFPAATLNLPGLTDKDRRDLAFGVQANVDYVAVSFVRKAKHILETKAFIRELGADIPVIAKIEKPEAVAAIGKIMAVCDGIMIARGDLGVEIPAVRVPYIQKQLIEQAREAEIPVITATQMLESMTEKPRPTRAEVADIAKAVEDGTDAVMLSGETASGKYPIQAVTTMSAVVMETESRIREAPNPYLTVSARKKLIPALARGLALISDNVNLAVIAVATHSGRTVCALSKTHPDAPILALSHCESTLRRVSLYHGVHPCKLNNTEDAGDIFNAAKQAAQALNLAQKGDTIALVWDPEWQGGTQGSLATRFGRI